ncbi:DUF4194 domain-containing protein [Endozoicomonas atrinae]|uniref:DUF4194 domain-containing protein n=1 Tax=Endozoicomonas atrinae TaxID=1333660 RepID=UPI000B30C16F|nr:DUF4194 domain-containing protein [Endozoicomonas atrinae]
MSNETPVGQASALFDQLIQSTAEEQDKSDQILGEPDNRSEDSQEKRVSSTDDEPNFRLAPEARRALIRLMRQGVVNAKSNSAVFETLRRYQAPIQEHLAEMYLKMVLDPQAGIALLQEQAMEDLESEDEEPVSLISRRTLSVYDTLLLLVLRKYFQERESAGEQQVVIDIDHIESLLTPFLPLTNSSRSDRRNLNGALDKMKERKILTGSKDGERFEITPVIRYVVNADFLQEMLASYLSLAGKPVGEEPSETEGSSDDE